MVSYLVFSHAYARRLIHFDDIMKQVKTLCGDTSVVLALITSCLNGDSVASMSERIGFLDAASLSSMDGDVLSFMYNNDISAHSRNNVSIGNSASVDRGFWIDGFFFIRMRDPSCCYAIVGGLNDILGEIHDDSGFMIGSNHPTAWRPYHLRVNGEKHELLVVSNDHPSDYESIRRSFIMTRDILVSHHTRVVPPITPTTNVTQASTSASALPTTNASGAVVHLTRSTMSSSITKRAYCTPSYVAVNLHHWRDGDACSPSDDWRSTAARVWSELMSDDDECLSPLLMVLPECQRSGGSSAATDAAADASFIMCRSPSVSDVDINVARFLMARSHDRYRGLGKLPLKGFILASVPKSGNPFEDPVMSAALSISSACWPYGPCHPHYCERVRCRHLCISVISYE